MAYKDIWHTVSTASIRECSWQEVDSHRVFKGKVYFEKVDKVGRNAQCFKSEMIIHDSGDLFFCLHSHYIYSGTEPQFSFGELSPHSPSGDTMRRMLGMAACFGVAYQNWTSSLEGRDN